MKLADLQRSVKRFAWHTQSLIAKAAKPAHHRNQHLHGTIGKACSKFLFVRRNNNNDNATD